MFSFQLIITHPIIISIECMFFGIVSVSNLSSRRTLHLHYQMAPKNLSKAINLTANQYFQYSPLAGFKFLLELKEYRLQRILWSLILLSTFGFSIYVVLYAWWTFTSNPTITTLESQEYPIWNIPFPAVAVCSVNKFSLKAVKENSKMTPKADESQLRESMLHLASLYDISSANISDATNFQTILDFYDSNKDTGFYDIRGIMERLAPKCGDMLMRCHWMGQEQNCKDLFTLQPTADGFCCTFNYKRIKNRSKKATNILRGNLTGSPRGLLVLLNGSTSDYFYSNRNTIGYVIQLFSPGNFPDTTTGNLREYVLNPGREVFLKLQVTTLLSSDSIRPYGINQRKCLFKDERKEEYGNHYSYAECLTKCKLRSIYALCNCIPFYAPEDFKIATEQTVAYCTLANIKCLERYIVTWNTYKPRGGKIEGLEREQEDSLNCPDCYPLCSTTSYNFETTSATIQSTASNRTSWGLLDGLANLSSVSLLRIYFASPASVLYETDVLYTWYEILGNMGGLLGLCLSCSIISLVELIYFCTIKLHDNQRKITKNAGKVPRKRKDVFLTQHSAQTGQISRQRKDKNLAPFDYME